MEFCCGFRKDVDTTAICFEEYGPASKVLRVDKITLPALGPEEILIEVKATSINPHDWKTMEGQLKDNLVIKFPYVPGRDFAGLVKKVGSKVSKFSSGDRVFGYQPAKYNGAFAQNVLVNQKYVAALPEYMQFDEAASVPFCALLAHHVLTEILHVTYNKKVWITNGSGGIGCWAVQIAKELGAIVIATTSNENKTWLRRLGADQSLDYKSQKGDFPKDVDYVFDTVGDLKNKNPMRFMKPGGTICSVVEEIDPAMAQMYNVNAKYYDMDAPADKLPDLLTMITGGKIKPQITKKFTFVDIPKGLDLSKMGHVDGKIIITVDEKDILKAKELKEKMFFLDKPKKQTGGNTEKKADEKELEPVKLTPTPDGPTNINLE